MALNTDAGRDASSRQIQQSEGQAGSILGWKELTAQRVPSQHRGRRRLLVVTSVVLLILIAFGALRLSMVAGATNDQLQVRIGDQQPALVDLRQGSPISPYLFGVNTFPGDGTSSLDKISSGFMHYTPLVNGDLQGMHIGLLRYPGGKWGEEHILSYNQLSDFSKLLLKTKSQGMLQAHLSGPVKNEQGDPQPHDLSADVNTRANLAGRWVDYMNNPKSEQRTGAHVHDPFYPIKFWTVGNEPDQLENPATPGQKYTVADYVNAFIQFSKAMHQNDAKIKVFGPELSQFYGIGAGPFDTSNHAWMDDFLKGVSAYEQAHHVTLLDGVSFHRYQFDDAHQAPAMLLSSSDEWNYLLPPLHQSIKRYFTHDLPIAVTEVNTNPGDGVPSQGLASLWWADTLGTLMNQQVEYTAFFSASDVEHPYPLFKNYGRQETPMARVMQLFSHLQDQLIPVGVQHEPISLYATQDGTHQKVSLLFVNKSPLTQLVQVNPVNQLAIVSPWSTLNVSLAPYSMIALTLHRGVTLQSGGAETYSYIVPSSNNMQMEPLTYTVCGHKADELANDIPC